MADRLQQLRSWIAQSPNRRNFVRLGVFAVFLGIILLALTALGHDANASFPQAMLASLAGTFLVVEFLLALRK
jgi:hypothetical protein